MKLSKILHNITNLNYKDGDFNSIQIDSRKVNENDLFIAIKGQNIDSRKFINQVIDKKVSFIIAHSDSNDYIELKNDIQIIYIKDLSSKVSKIADAYFNSPSKKLKVLGITGTNGKTTIAQLTAQWGYLLGEKTATLGTIGNGCYPNLKEAKNTTGGPLEIQENIADFVDKGSDLITMEVSSHGLEQHRLNSIDFDVAAFTNLTQDHLDYHKTMENYFKAKSILFTKFDTNAKVINIDDDFGYKLASSIDDDSIIAVSCKNNNLAQKFANYIYLTNVDYNDNGTVISFKSSFSNSEETFTVKLIGTFNTSNILVTLGCMLGLEYNIDELLSCAKQLNPVIGRMEVFKAKNSPTIIIDYAHTPDALEKALQACKTHTKNKLWCIFGCGGDRDKTKRPLMAQAAENNSDKVIITDDNPRTEDHKAIVKDVIEGISNKKTSKIIHDRFSAIKYAVENANSDDLILVAGKGHEDYQILGSQTIHYSDRESAKTILDIK